jgi:hypothetical protein
MLWAGMESAHDSDARGPPPPAGGRVDQAAGDAAWASPLFLNDFVAAVAAEEAAAAAAWGGDRRFLQEDAATPGADGSVAALTIPLVGLGTGGLQPGAETSHSVFWALIAGYRLIDTASEVTPNPSHLRLIHSFIRESGL